MRSKYLRPDRQGRFPGKSFRRAEFHRSTDRISNFPADHLTKPRFFLDDEDVIRRLGQKSFAHALWESPQRKTHVLGALNTLIDDLIQAGWRLLARAHADDQPAAPAPGEP